MSTKIIKNLDTSDNPTFGSLKIGDAFAKGSSNHILLKYNNFFAFSFDDKTTNEFNTFDYVTPVNLSITVTLA